MSRKKYAKRCDCNGGLGGDGWATEYWKGDIVCKECKRRDQNVAYLLSDNMGVVNTEKFKKALRVNE